MIYRIYKQAIDTHKPDRWEVATSNIFVDATSAEDWISADSVLHSNDAAKFRTLCDAIEFNARQRLPIYRYAVIGLEK